VTVVGESEEGGNITLEDGRNDTLDVTI